MARITPQEMADKWNRRLKAATPDIQAGVRRVTQAPGVKAAQQQNVMLQNLQARVADGTWARKVAGVSLDEWQSKTLNKGVGRIAAGVDASMSTTTDQFGKVLQAVDASVAVVERTPRGDLSTNINRAVTFMTEMANRAPSRQK